MHITQTFCTSFTGSDDSFNWNYGIALAATGDYSLAEETLLLIRNISYKEDLCYNAWLSKCYIMKGKPEKAWELYSKIQSASESFQLLQLIANDCYRMGHFVFAAKAFHILESVDGDPDFGDGRRGACVGAFLKITKLKAQGNDMMREQFSDDLAEIIQILKESDNDIDTEIMEEIQKWLKINRLDK